MKSFINTKKGSIAIGQSSEKLIVDKEYDSAYFWQALGMPSNVTAESEAPPAPRRKKGHQSSLVLRHKGK